MTEDVDEAPFVYGFLADLVEQNNAHILGAQNCNLPRVVQIIAEAVAVDVLPPDSPIKLRLVNIIKQVKVRTERFKSRDTDVFSRGTIVYSKPVLPS